MRRVGIGLACAALLALCAGTAYGQERGAFVDPNSPSGKEYEIPFESARRQADPRPVSPENVASRTSQATLFGEGVTSSSTSGGPRKSSGSASAKDSDGRGTGSVGDRRPDVVKIATSKPGAPDSGLGPMLVLGIGFLVLLVGAGAGIIVRRRTD